MDFYLNEVLKRKYIQVYLNPMLLSIVCETYRAHTGVIFKKLEILKVPDLVKFNSLCFLYKYDRARDYSTFL